MKKLVRNSEIHLRDILKYVIHIEICEDITRAPRYLAASTDLDDSDEFARLLKEEKMTLTLTDEQLLKMSDAYLNSIEDGELLHRINKLCPERLSAEQLAILSKYYSDTRIDIDDADIVDFLDKLKSCESISYSYTNKRTNAFALDSGRKLRSDDCISIIQSLTLEDYREGMYGADKHYYGDNLLVFRTNVEWVDNLGQIYSDLQVYIKLDLDKTTGDCIALVSFHEAKYED